MDMFEVFMVLIAFGTLLVGFLTLIVEIINKNRPPKPVNAKFVEVYSAEADSLENRLSEDHSCSCGLFIKR